MRLYEIQSKINEYKRFEVPDSLATKPTDDDDELGIGPHEGQEQDLMRRGLKPMALILPNNIKKWMEIYSEGIVKIKANPVLENNFIAVLPGEEWRIDRYAKLRNKWDAGKITDDHYHFILGRLLGYTKEQFKIFKKRLERFKNAG